MNIYVGVDMVTPALHQTSWFGTPFNRDHEMPENYNIPQEEDMVFDKPKLIVKDLMTDFEKSPDRINEVMSAIHKQSTAITDLKDSLPMWAYGYHGGQDWSQQQALAQAAVHGIQNAVSGHATNATFNYRSITTLPGDPV